MYIFAPMKTLEIKAKKVAGAKKHLYRWLKIVLLVYCLVGIAIFYAQDFLILHPTVQNKDYV